MAAQTLIALWSEAHDWQLGKQAGRQGLVAKPPKASV
jgi:hypothetical protein